MHYLHAWHQLPALTADDFAQIIGENLSVDDNQPVSLEGCTHAARLSLFAAANDLEVRLSVIVEEAMLEWFRQRLLGAPDTNDEATRDALRELANTTGGCFKRAALAEGVTLTTGLPVDDPSPSLPNTARRFSLNVGEKRILVAAELRSRTRVRVAATHLLEGMVPVHDVYAANGALLVAAGARLTQTTITSLAQSLSAQAYIDVCNDN